MKNFQLLGAEPKRAFPWPVPGNIGVLLVLGFVAVGVPATGASTDAAQSANRLDEVLVTVAPVSYVRQREGITGAGWGVAYDVSEPAPAARKIVNIYPNHPDDWGKTAGTGASHSLDLGMTWTPDADNSPIKEMVDMWQDRLRDGMLVTLGIRALPDRQKPPPVGGDGFYRGVYSLGLSRDQGKSWSFASTTALSPAALGPLARPLPRIMQEPDGSLLMPGYSWNQQGSVAVLLRSRDLAKTWEVASTIATATAVRALGIPVSTPWFENMVERVADGSLLAVIRTSSNARGALVTTRSTDNGATWSPPALVRAGPQGKNVAGKLPNLCLLPNGVLVLLTAHTRDHCRIYLSLDGTGLEWSDAYVVTSHTGGNTSMVSTDYDKFVIFTPATGRIACWQVIVSRCGRERMDLRANHAAGGVAIETDLQATSAMNPAMGIRGPLDGSINYSNAAMSKPHVNRGTYTLALDRIHPLQEIGLALKAGEPESAQVYLSKDGRQWEKSGVALENWVSRAARHFTFTPGTAARFVKIELSAPRGPVVLGEVALYPARAERRVPAPTSVAVSARGALVEVTWSAPPGEAVAGYLVTPRMLKPPEGDNDMQPYPYAAIRTRDAATRLDLGSVLARGATYRLEVAAIDREGRISASASTADFVAAAPKPATVP